MNTQQALEVLKRIQEGEQTTQHDFDEALSVAIEVMEARKDEIVKAFEEGWESGVVYRESGDAEQYFNSLTRPQSDTETGI